MSAHLAIYLWFAICGIALLGSAFSESFRGVAMSLSFMFAGILLLAVLEVLA